MRQSEAAYALIFRSETGTTQWLARWNRGWEAYNFVGGCRNPDETFHQCLVREIREELGLQSGQDFSVAAKPLSLLRFPAWSKRVSEQTNYSLALFEVKLEENISKLISDRRNSRWLTESEIHEGVTINGEPISPTMARVLTETRLWNRSFDRGASSTPSNAPDTQEDSLKMTPTYQPQPFDTSDIEIPAELEGLLEVLASHNHEVWARQRVSQGWSYGPRRDDEKRQSPCLVPYAELPEEEKEYDRSSAAATIRAMLKLGVQITPPSNSHLVVLWLPRAFDRVRDKAWIDKWGQDLREVFGHRAGQIVVSDVFRGYSIREDEQVVLGVQSKSSEGPKSYVVKLGDPRKIDSDYTRWCRCMRDSSTSSVVLANVRGYHLLSGRSAAVYEDAYRMFGTDPAAESPHLLEEVCATALSEKGATVDSVEQVLEQIFGQLNRTLYFRSTEGDAQHVRGFYTEQLLRHDKESAWQRWRSQKKLLALRGHAVWLTSLDTLPTDSELPRYLDPVDYLDWALFEGHSVPNTLVGHSHGDLHARNVLVGYYRHRAQQPVVFDYGDMNASNLVVWDFVKLEAELTSTLLTALLSDPKAREALRQKAPELGRAARECDSVVMSLEEEGLVRCVDHLESAFVFETLLAQYALNINGKESAERSLSDSDLNYSTGYLPVDQALRILFRIRQEAAFYLVYEKERPRSWREEYYFALAVYGLLKAKWSSECRMLEIPLILAGVAARQHQYAVVGQQQIAELWALRTQSPPAEYPSRCLPSHLFALSWAHQLWSEKRHDEAIAMLDKANDAFPQAFTLKPELALCFASIGNTFRAEELLRELRPWCRVFRDQETLCRIGRVFKDAGDRAFADDPAENPRELAASGHPAEQLYRTSYKVYRQAYEVSVAHDRYYPAINAATLAMLLGHEEEATQLALHADELCAKATDDQDGLGLLDTEKRVWLFATRGEAQLLLHKARMAESQYRLALNMLRDRKWQVVESMFHQVCRLHWVLGGEVVQPVVDLFARTVDLRTLSPGPFGSCGQIP